VRNGFCFRAAAFFELDFFAWADLAAGRAFFTAREARSFFALEFALGFAFGAAVTFFLAPLDFLAFLAAARRATGERLLFSFAVRLLIIFLGDPFCLNSILTRIKSVGSRTYLISWAVASQENPKISRNRPLFEEREAGDCNIWRTTL
jgi:hypothetical protein